VRSHNRSVSGTYLFYPRDQFDDSDCPNVDLDSYQKLSDVYVYWTYEKVRLIVRCRLSMFGCLKVFLSIA